MHACRLLLLSFVVPLAGCAVFRHLAGKDTVTLEKAQVKTMGVDIRREQKTICPRQRVQMAVFADVILDGEQKVSKLETWQARGPKNGKLDFSEFAFRSETGTFDDEGWFSPNRNLLATVGREFRIKTVYRRRPDKFTFTTNYKPDYDCIKGAGRDGSPGSAGAAGAQGSAGTPGSAGIYTTKYVPATTPGGYSTTQSEQGPGGNGGNGSRGGPGGAGTPGGPGGHFAIYVTLVKTPYYDKLVAARLVGGIDDFLLFPPEKVLHFHANGGPGGAGGAGGPGGPGGAGGSGNPPGMSGQTGAQGPGGNGGMGGTGGSIEVTLDARFESELRTVIEARANGGSGGIGGSGGGIAGSPGAPGHVTLSTGDVRGRFSGLGGVTVL